MIAIVLPSSSSNGLSEIAGMPSVCSVFGELFRATPAGLVRSLSGVASNFEGLVLPASGDDGSAETLVLVRRTPEPLISSSTSFLELLFLVVTLPLRGVILRLCFVVDVICASSSLFSLPWGSDFNELRRVLRLCGVVVVVVELALL